MKIEKLLRNLKIMNKKLLGEFKKWFEKIIKEKSKSRKKKLIKN